MRQLQRPRRIRLRRRSERRGELRWLRPAGWSDEQEHRIRIGPGLYCDQLRERRPMREGWLSHQ